MKRNMWWTLMLIAALSMALTMAVACGDDDDDDAAGDDDADGDDDDTTGGAAYDQCLEWAEECGFGGFEVGTYCDSLQSLETDNACIDDATGAYFDCLLGSGCTDYTGILGCIAQFTSAVAGCY